MKRSITAIVTAAVILTNLTACDNSGSGISQSDQSFSSDENSQSGDADSDTCGPGVPDDNSGKEIKTRYVYGEVEIPDIPDLSEGEEGRAHTWEGYLDQDRYLEKSKEFERCLDSMVFETHTLGEYTVSLVGDKVRTDSKKFPGYIFIQHFRAEVEKNGEHIGDISDGGWLNYLPQFGEELRLHADKIGDYIDLYDLEEPIITLRYWFDDDPRRLVTKCVSFVALTEVPYNRALSVEKGIGVTFNPVAPNSPYDRLAPNEADGDTILWSIFGSDEFKVVDKNTLLDEEAGIEFTFDFTKDTNPLHPKDYIFGAKWVN
ncbi:MAG: hypothetical protein K2N56_03565 [Oscillospiraceae bacterium]|nr:hypothetical protein [Oscillospiraceae bacterium]